MGGDSSQSHSEIPGATLPFQTEVEVRASDWLFLLFLPSG